MSLVPCKQLRYAFTVASGATPESGNADYWDGNIRWATPEDVGGLKGYWLSNTRRKITRAGYESCAAPLAPRGSIVLTKRAPIGQLAILAEAACSNQGCFLLASRGDQDCRYYYYWLSDRADFLQALGRGSTFMELSTDDLKQLEIPDPPLKKQRAIADYLDRETARIDALIAAKQRLIDLLDEKRRALVARAVTRGINPAAPLRDCGIPWLGEIPAHWEAERIGWLFRERDEREEPDLPLLEVSIKNGVILREFSAERIEATAADFGSYKVARKGDVVFNKMRMWQGAVGVAQQDGLVSPDYLVAAPTEALTSPYAGHLFRIPAFSAECARRSHGIVWDRLRLYWEGFREIAVPVPPQPEQVEICRQIQKDSARIEKACALTGEAITLLRERRAAVIAAAVTGQLDGREPLRAAAAATAGGGPRRLRIE